MEFDRRNYDRSVVMDPRMGVRYRSACTSKWNDGLNPRSAEAQAKMLKRARSSKSIGVAWLCVLLWGFASPAAASQAPAKDKNPDAESGFVTSWDGAKIHYIEAGRSRRPVGSAEAGNPLPSPVTATKGSISV